jgi:hypothetical protein
MSAGSKEVSTGAFHYEKIEPQSFVARNEMSASGWVAIRVSYVHAGIKILHLAQLLEIHRIIGTWEDLVHFSLQALIAGWLEQQVIKHRGQCRLDRIRASHDGEGAIGKDICDGGALSFQPALIDLDMI